MTRALNGLVIVTLLVGFTLPGWAQETDIGKVEYQSSCAACHGVDGKGAGPLASGGDCGREIDALGANRQRLTTLMKSVPGSRLLPDNFFNVPQNIVVPMDTLEILASINAFIDDLRTSGFLADAVARSGVVGIEAAPKSLGSQHGCPG